MAGLRRLQRDVHRHFVADLADEDHVRVLPKRGAQRVGEAVRIDADLALADARLLVAVQELDGSSTVTMWRACVVFRWPIIAAMVELFPLPAAPTTSTSPRSFSQSGRHGAGAPSSSNVGMMNGIVRITIASDPRCR